MLVFNCNGLIRFYKQRCEFFGFSYVLHSTHLSGAFPPHLKEMFFNGKPLCLCMLGNVCASSALLSDILAGYRVDTLCCISG